MSRIPPRRSPPRPQPSGVEVILIPGKPRVRGAIDTSATAAAKPTAMFTCESGCVRSDIAKLVAGAVCSQLPAKHSVRFELDDASAKNREKGALCQRIARATVLEGCSIQCASRMLRDLLPNADLAVIPVDQFYKLEGNPFVLDDIKPAKLAKITYQAAEGILSVIRHDGVGSL